MIEGTFRDDWPVVLLTVIGETGRRVVEFIVDTGFGGSLAMPDFLLQQIGATYAGSDEYQLADGTPRRFGFSLVAIAEDEDERVFSVLAKEGNPLLGIEFLRELHLHIEVTDGGTVIAEPL